MDMYPYKKYTISESAIKNAFEKLNKYILLFKFIDAKTRPRINYMKPEFKYPYFVKDGRQVYMQVVKENYEMDMLSDFFQEHQRVLGYRFQDKMSSYDYWNKNSDSLIDSIVASKKDINSTLLRDTLWHAHYELTTFRPTLQTGLIKFFNAVDILDISSGWGDRLIGALAVPSCRYTGFDPNKKLFSGYNFIQDLFDEDARLTDLSASSKRSVVYNSPFEKGATCLDDESFDLVLSSPPYFTLEIYTEDPSQSVYNGNKLKTCNEWYETFLKPSLTLAWAKLKYYGHLVLNIVNADKDKYVEDMILFINKFEDSEFLGMLPQWDGSTTKSGQPFWIWKKVIKPESRHVEELVSIDIDIEQDTAVDMPSISMDVLDTRRMIKDVDDLKTVREEQKPTTRRRAAMND
jgi:hypothetical protein